MLNLCYVYYLSKLTEFMDTIFFVCRKKKSQITWLHLYHHSLTPLEAWILVKFIAGMCVLFYFLVFIYDIISHPTKKKSSYDRHNHT